MEPTLLKKETEILLDMMGIHVKEVIIIQDLDLHITIISVRAGGNETELFRENNESVLRDFTLILKQLIEKKYHQYKDIIVDLNGENKKHLDLLKQQAQIAVERVEFFDKPYEFGYLNAYERMIIHSYLKNKKDIVTESYGERNERSLVIKKNTA